eukprot:753712-Hanusia_phi.AAC.10
MSTECSRAISRPGITMLVALLPYRSNSFVQSAQCYFWGTNYPEEEVRGWVIADFPPGQGVLENSESGTGGEFDEEI